MKTITIIGWSAKSSSVVERVTFWPDEMEAFLAVAKAMQVTDLMTVEEVLVESGEEEMTISYDAEAAIRESKSKSK